VERYGNPAFEAYGGREEAMAAVKLVDGCCRLVI
jgi:hypothetical protein